MSVVVADSEPHSRFAISLILRRAGYEVIGIESSLEAIRQTLETHWNVGCLELLVVDPQGSGLTVTELKGAIDRLGVDLPVLFLGWVVDPAGEGEAREVKGNAINLLEKPFLQSDLLNRVEAIVLRRSRQNAQRGVRQSVRPEES